MIAMPRRESGDDGAVAADIVDIGDALPAAPGAAIVIGGGQLAIAIGADGEDELFLRGQFDEAFRAHLRRSFLLRLPRGEAQIIVALLLIGARAVTDGERDDIIDRKSTRLNSSH